MLEQEHEGRRQGSKRNCLDGGEWWGFSRLVPVELPGGAVVWFALSFLRKVDRQREDGFFVSTPHRLSGFRGTISGRAIALDA